jgi:RNA polymerase sigma factor (TIGR02999 family)
MTDATQLLLDDLHAQHSDRATSADLLALVYGDLRRLAGNYLRRERSGHTLSATDLVHEAYTRMVDQTRVGWQGRTHFLAIAAQAMRRILVDHARRRATAKRGGDWRRVTLDPAVQGILGEHTFALDDLITLDEALAQLSTIDPRQARVVELRYFAGMTIDEIAEELGVSTRSVDRDWTHARSWLKRELSARKPS